MQCVLNKIRFSGLFGYLQAIVLSNLVGASVSFAVSFLIFLQWQNEGTKGLNSFSSDALSVSSFLFFVGLTYSMIAISPITIIFKKQTRILQLVTLLLALAPGLLMLGSGYWDVLALSYGLSTVLVFLTIYSTHEAEL